MSQASHNLHIRERTLIAVFVILVILLSPVSSLWGSLDAPWYSPYLVWAAIILISWLLQKHIRRHEI